MTSFFTLSLAFLWLASAFFDYVQFTALLQLKEYRLDRFRDFLSTKKGKEYWFQYPLLWRSCVALTIFFWPMNDLLFIKRSLFVVLTFDLMYFGYRAFKHKIARPKLTVKAFFIVVACILAEAAFFAVTRDWAHIFLLLILRFSIVSAVVILLWIPTIAAKRYYVAKAAKKLTQFPKLIVIGVTGSYGKTTVKVFLYQILLAKYKVIYTPKNINTEIGVAKFILKNDLRTVDIMVVEMGAYKKGEIALIANMVRPTIGILTAINEQHLSLFGSMKNIQDAKYELLRAIPKDGLAITNSDNSYCREFLHELQAKVQTFGVEEAWHPTFRIIDIQEKPTGTVADAEVEGKKIHVKTRLLGAHIAMNLAPAYLVARFLDVPEQDILEKMEHLLTPKGTLEIYYYGTSLIIDDSYNANPDGFRSALHTLGTFPSNRKRVVITRGMIELGEKSDELHERIAEEISFIADELVIITTDYERALRKGINTKYHINVKTITDAADIRTYLRNLKDTGAVVLVENRVPQIVRDEWLAKSFA